ncbi:MAG: hypothetical protein R3E95_02770 [Thiolinea sp.]
MQPHPAGFGDLEHFLQVRMGAGEVVRVAVQGSAGEQTAWQHILHSLHANLPPPDLFIHPSAALRNRPSAAL